jgi:hypothetical protein
VEQFCLCEEIVPVLYSTVVLDRTVVRSTALHCTGQADGERQSAIKRQSGVVGLVGGRDGTVQYGTVRVVGW